MGRPTIAAVDVDRLDDEGCARDITIRTSDGRATLIDLDTEAGLNSLMEICFSVGAFDAIHDTDELVGRRIMAPNEVTQARAKHLASLFA